MARHCNRFQAILVAGHKGSALEVPFDPGVEWGIPPAPLWKGRRGHTVQGTLNGLAFEGFVVPRSGKFWLLVEERVQTGVQANLGDTVEAMISPKQR